VSRQREFLADASSVQFYAQSRRTLRRAPKNRASMVSVRGLESEHAPTCAICFSATAWANRSLASWPTHPPIPDRVRAIDPTWDGKFRRWTKSKSRWLKRAAISELEHTPKPMPDLFKDRAGGAIIASGSTSTPPVIRSRSVMPNLGNPTPLHLKYAVQLRDSLPESIKAAAREPLDAVAPDLCDVASVRMKRCARRSSPNWPNALTRQCRRKCVALFPDVSAAAQHAHLPIVNLALGALRQLRPEQFNQFSQTLQWLIESDGKVELV